MNNFFDKLANKYQKFMYGRNGNDRFNNFLIVIYCIIVVISGLLNRSSNSTVRFISNILLIICLLIIAFAIFRIFSKNIDKRHKENLKYLALKTNIRVKIKLSKDKVTMRKTHKFIKCKNCKSVLRLPKNKGNIKVTCPKCKNEFVVNTGKKI